MKPEDFQEVVGHMLDHCNSTLVLKAKEYSRNNDSLHNFNKGVEMSDKNESREEVIWGMARKHWISITDIRNDVKIGNLPSQSMIDEKFGDMINYLLIEYASITDKINTLEVESIVPSAGRRK